MEKILIRNTLIVTLVTVGVSVTLSIFGSHFSVAAGQGKTDKKSGQTIVDSSHSPSNNGNDAQELCKPKCSKEEVCNKQTKKCDLKGPLD